MIQVKCGECQMVSNISEEHFLRHCDSKIKQSLLELRCISCGERFPRRLEEHIYRTIQGIDFEGWEIGTYLP